MPYVMFCPLAWVGMEKWEQARVDRLEDRIAQIERKNWERSDFTFRLIVNGLTAAIVILAIVTIVLSASNPGN